MLDQLAGSERVWHRRMAVMATFAFIRDGEFDPTLRLAGRLLHEPHELVHKAVGWMLREIGNRDHACAEAFLDEHAASMPRVMLRSAVEKYPASRRRHYLDLPRTQPRVGRPFNPVCVLAEGRYPPSRTLLRWESGVGRRRVHGCSNEPPRPRVGCGRGARARGWPGGLPWPASLCRWCCSRWRSGHSRRLICAGT